MIDIDMIIGMVWVSVWIMDELDDHSFSFAAYDDFGIYLKVVVDFSYVAFALELSSPKSISYVSFYPRPTCVAVFLDPIIHFGLFKYYLVSIISTSRIDSVHEEIYVFLVFISVRILEYSKTFKYH